MFTPDVTLVPGAKRSLDELAQKYPNVFSVTRTMSKREAEDEEDADLSDSFLCGSDNGVVPSVNSQPGDVVRARGPMIECLSRDKMIDE